MKFSWAAGLAVGMACTACAGDDYPALDRQLADQIAATYGGSGAVGAAGGGGASAGTGGSSAETVAAVAVVQPSEMTSAAPEGAGGSSNEPAPVDSAAGGGTAAPPASKPRCDGFAILAANCATSGCHGTGSNLGTFAASEADARTYVGKDGTVACKGQGPVINPKDPSSSLLVEKLEDFPPCGNHMPLAGDPLSSSDVKCIEDWIGGLQ